MHKTMQIKERANNFYFGITNRFVCINVRKDKKISNIPGTLWYII